MSDKTAAYFLLRVLRKLKSKLRVQCNYIYFNSGDKQLRRTQYANYYNYNYNYYNRYGFMLHRYLKRHFTVHTLVQLSNSFSKLLIIIIFCQTIIIITPVQRIAVYQLASDPQSIQLKGCSCTDSSFMLHTYMLYYSTSTSWRRRGSKRVPRSDLD